MKISNLSTLASATFVTALLTLTPALVQAGGGQTFDKEMLEDTSKGVDLGLGKFAAFPFHVSVTVRGGYDDNVNLTSSDEQGSAFASTQLGLSYNFGSPRTTLALAAGGGVTYYFDRTDNGFNSSDSYDVNGYVSFSITHKATPRLTLAASTYATYQSQPDFTTFNFGAINFSRQSQNFFFTVNKFSAGYAWAPRFSTLSSYTLGYTNYDDAVVSRFEDRFEHTLGNEFRFLIWPTTTLVAEYRFGIVDYTENDARSSTSHYFLGGFDHSFNPRFNMSLRAGVEVRNFDQNNTFLGNGDQTSPYAEATLNYAIAQNTSVSWTNRYSLEEPDVPDALSRTTFRTGLSLRHNFTARISAGLNFAYQHDENDSTPITQGFTEDSFELALWAKYAINRNFALDIGYDHTEVVSDTALFREYARNRVYGGVTFTF
ncbi:MAG: outer membrane beta-barrel protein [Chthoniobacterales bacterium]